MTALDSVDVPDAALRVYETLLLSTESTSEGLAERLNLETHETRTLLKELYELGVVREAEDGFWEPLNPVGPLRELMTEAESTMSAARTAREILSNLEQRLSRAYSFHVEREAENRAVEVIHGIEAANERLLAIGRSGPEHVMAMIPGPGFTSPAHYERALEAELDQLARGMVHRNIMDWTYLADPLREDGVRRLAEAGAEQRISPQPLPIRCVITPGMHVALPVTANDDGAAGTMIVHASSIVKLACELFELLWKQSVPVPMGHDAGLRPGSTLNDDDRILLNYLATGMPDESIARRLDVSSRTIRRRIHELSDRLGASSRFHLALCAREHGWQGGGTFDRGDTDVERDSQTVAG